MARPKKNNAEYFSHDADMRNDVRIKAIRRKYKLTGYAIWNFLLEVLTDSDYFEIGWSELDIELLSADFDVDVSELKAVVEYCISLGLLQQEDGVLFSENHQKRFNTLLSKRKRDLNRHQTALPTTETPQKEVFDSENPHSIVKESIVEYSKVNEIKEKESVVGAEAPDDTTQKFKNFNLFIENNAPRVAKMQEPFTERQYRVIISRAKGKNIDTKTRWIGDILKEMHNKPNLTTKYTSAYITYQLFEKQRIKQNGN